MNTKSLRFSISNMYNTASATRYWVSQTDICLLLKETERNYVILSIRNLLLAAMVGCWLHFPFASSVKKEQLRQKNTSRKQKDGDNLTVCARTQNEVKGKNLSEHSCVEVIWMVNCILEIADVIGFSCLDGAEEREQAVQEQANLLI